MAPRMAKVAAMCLACTTFLLQAHTTMAIDAEAVFSGPATGKITFAEAGGVTVVSVELANMQAGANGYHVHELPVGEGCGSGSTGGHWNPTNVAVPANCPTDPSQCEIGDLSGKHGKLSGATVSETYTDAELPLSGPHSIVGRSVVIHDAVDNSRWACATINPIAAMTTVVATFNGPAVVGTITLMQMAGSASADTTVLVDLQPAAGSSGSFDHNWHVHVSPVDSSGDCASAEGHYDPLSVGTAICGTASIFDKAGSCEVGDMSGKHGAINVPKRVMYTDSNLPLTGAYSVAERSVVLHAADKGAGRLACASFTPPAPVAEAVFSGPATGKITFAEAGGVTVVSVELANMQAGANGYHVHELPVGEGCGSGSTGGHWNPTNVAVPANCPTDPSQCEIGDLSGKHGKLSGATVSETYTDAELPLSGPHSIVGRSVVIHDAVDNSRWACATINPIAAMTTVVATFNGPAVVGTITLMQMAGSASADTTVLVDLQPAAGSSGSFDHNWHVHVSPVDSSGDCASAEGHYDPLSVGTAICGTASIFDKAGSCEVGDMSGKHGAINVPKRVMYTDSNLPLTGAYSVAERSVVLHAADKGAGRLACASFTPPAPVAEAVFSGPATGKITFAEAGGVTVVSVELANMQAGANGYHVHELPVGEGCGSSSTGGHWNPTNVAVPANCPTDPSQCEIGDLSGKHGKLSGATVSETYTDAELPLSGPHSIVGRSVVIHDAVDNSRWACATINPIAAMTTVVATFNGPAVVGTITLMQMAGSASADTTVLVDLQPAAGSSGSFDHNWHVHVSPVDSSGDCASAEGHYDPLSVGTAICGTASIFDKAGSCEVGDMSGKHGAINVPKRVMYTDSNLPLTGAYSVAERSVVLHAADKGAGRLACASFAPPAPVAEAVFSGPATGKITFAEAGGVTVVSVELANMQAGANGYHVHELPVGEGCGSSSTGGHWNPTNVAVPANCPTDPSQCEIGDLSGKHGKLSGATVSETYTDAELPLSGPHSIVGRSVVIHDAVDNSRWACATINPIAAMTTVVATFNGPAVVGTITLMQMAGSASADTTVLVDLQPAAGSSGSFDHNWHVHVSPVDSSGDCASAEGHYDPLSVGTAICGTASIFDKAGSCEVGDMSGKHGAISVPKRAMYTDSNLPLTGAYSVAERSVVLHAADKGAGRLACASFAPPAPVAEAVFSGPATGKITFAEAGGVTVVSVELANMQAGANGYHVHELPVGEGCGSSSTGGHWNPTNVAVPANCPTDPSQCEIGDLSGKHGKLSGATVSETYTDAELPLSGPHSIVGRSVVIHDAVDNSRWACATINPIAAMTTVVATFNGPAVVGTITLMQMAGSASADTTVLVDLQPAAGSSGSFDHNWHVHVSPVDSSGDCASAEGHYDPLSVGTAICGTASIFDKAGSCEVGDMSGKHGAINVPKRAMYTDSNLPLTGAYSVAERSVVLHAADKGAGRLACASFAPPAPVAEALFSGPATGKITFAEAGGVTVVSVELANMQAGANGYHVHELPVGEGCGSSSTGGHWNPTNVAVPANCPTDPSQCEIGDLSGKHGKLSGATVSETYTDAELPLSGPHSIVGRSVVIHDAVDNSRWACATINPIAAMTTVVATFNGPAVVGTITLMQMAGSASADTTVLVDLQPAAGSSGSFDHNWHVHVSPVDSSGDCASAEGHYDPLSVGTAICGTASIFDKAGSCEVGDMSGKHGAISVPKRAMYTDSNLPLTGAYSVAERSVVLHAADKGAGRLACASFAPPAPVAEAVFSGPATGKITFAEAGGVTVVSVELANMQAGANGYHVHELPVGEGCGSSSTGGHWNPTNVAVPANCPTDPSQCEIGDLSGKHGKLSGATVSETYTDAELPLSGPHSIVGRSVVIHDAVDNSRWACATINPIAAMTTVVATFNGPAVVGTITLMQMAGSASADTTVLVDLQPAAGSSGSFDHNWHVHVSPVDSSGDCASAEGHYDPLSVGTAICGTASIFDKAGSCEVGDMSGKHGAISVPKRAMYTDSNLPLTGAYSVAERSVVLHAADKGAGRLACASFAPPAPVAEAVFSGPATGKITFAEAGGVTVVSVELANMQAGANGYHVHELPVGEGCGSSSTGGHWNPTNVAVPANCPTDPSQCEIGDLSGKHGKLSGATVSETYTDAELPLSGPHSIVGRSVVIHDAVDNSRWACATINPIAAMTTVVATFNGPAVVGTITLMQMAGSASADTTVLVDLQPAAGSSGSFDHNWHVHVSPVDSSGDCASAEGHYDPLSVGTAICGTASIFDKAGSCEVGDMSGKHGAISVPKRAMYTDSNLPLTGAYSVAERSVVLHAADKGAGRLACASFAPPGENPYVPEAPASPGGAPPIVVSGGGGGIDTGVVIALCVLSAVVGMLGAFTVVAYMKGKAIGAAAGPGAYSTLGRVSLGADAMFSNAIYTARRSSLGILLGGTKIDEIKLSEKSSNDGTGHGGVGGVKTINISSKSESNV